MRKTKYSMIQDYIIEEISKKRLMVGDQIPTEVELTEIFKVSRQTISKALQNLSKDGYITRTPGKGSFVSLPSVHKSIRFHNSFTKDLESIGIKAGSKLLKYEQVMAHEIPLIANELDLDSNDYVHFFVRLRTGDDKPFALSYTYISSKVVPEIDVSVLSSSLLQYLNSLNIYPSRAIYELSSCSPTDYQAKVLGIDQKTSLLLNKHVTYDQQNRPFEYIETYYIGSKYSYNIEVKLESPNAE